MTATNMCSNLGSKWCSPPNYSLSFNVLQVIEIKSQVAVFQHTKDKLPKDGESKRLVGIVRRRVEVA